MSVLCMMLQQFILDNCMYPKIFKVTRREFPQDVLIGYHVTKGILYSLVNILLCKIYQNIHSLIDKRHATTYIHYITYSYFALKIKLK